MEHIFRCVDWLSGEWLLNKRPNGGAVVFVRSLKVSFLIFFLCLGLISVIDPARTFHPSLRELQIIVLDKFAWFGAIFAATYAGFYARYSSQWSYLSGLYNQIMATKSSLPEIERSNSSLLHWQAGFIEDCYLLHLDRKDIFSLPIQYMLSDAAILKTFKESCSDKISRTVISRHVQTEGLAKVNRTTKGEQ